IAASRRRRRRCRAVGRWWHGRVSARHRRTGERLRGPHPAGVGSQHRRRRHGARNRDPPMEATTDWGTAVVVDPRTLTDLRDRNAALRRTEAALRRTEVLLKVAIGILAAGCAVSAVVAYRQANRITDLHLQMSEYRRTTRNSERALGALARSHESILEATEKAPSIGTNSWGHRFTVTMYVPRSEAYG